MHILVKKITTGAEDQLGNIYETWIHGKTKNGYKIKAEVIRDYDLTEFIGKSVNCLILAYNLIAIQKETELKIDLVNERIFGEFLGKYDIPKVWNFKDIIPHYAIKTMDGIIMLYRSEVENKISNIFPEKMNKELEIGDIISFYPEKFKLLSFIPVENFKELHSKSK